MNRKIIKKICNILSIILLIVFIIKSFINYLQYDSMFNSAPFYLWIIINAIFILTPALIIYFIGLIIGK